MVLLSGMLVDVSTPLLAALLLFSPRVLLNLIGSYNCLIWCSWFMCDSDGELPLEPFY